MNDLVTVRKKVFIQRTKIRWRDKIVKMYLNDLLTKDNQYILTIIGKNSVRVEYLKLVNSWTGIITRANNKKLFDKLHLILRLINE
jgi:hypothetical protein